VRGPSNAHSGNVLPLVKGTHITIGGVDATRLLQLRPVTLEVIILAVLNPLLRNRKHGFSKYVIYILL